jgi:glutamine synthetase
VSTRSQITQMIEACPVPVKESFPKVSSYYGCNTFNEETMKKVLSDKTFNAFKKWQDSGAVISEKQADEIANAMKEWAMEKGATSYTHWFQPMTGLTAEKHDGFISVNGNDQVIEKFTGSKLIQGEPDASSFPSGGIRATFEARGYTAWDPSSPAYIAEVDLGRTLCIPSIFISYTGEALDKKLPLLRSDAAINKAAIDLLKLFGHDVQSVFSTCGAEQEYFLIDERYYKLRTDLQLAGRTLIGDASSKGQQLEDQYFGSIKERVLNYMNDVAEEAYKLGIPVTTRHNEVAPHQFEFAPIYERSNIAADHNQLLMDIMKKVAHRHQLVCLLHEKPFAGINGSGKHLNWSLADNKGNNLLNPGETPEENLQFLTILAAVMQAVHQHADLLRASVACAGNEHRLGANEAPPAIVSIFLGEQLTKIVTAIENGNLKKSKKNDSFDFGGVGLLPKVLVDQSDRNRTSPFAFTGAKFEFRAVGSSMNISTSIAVINTIVADSFNNIISRIQTELKSKKDFNTAVMAVLSTVVKESKNILFEGNNYSEDWVAEAKRRGLPNEPSTVEALKAFIKPANITLFEKNKVFSKVEMQARYHIWVDMYDKIIDIEAKTLREMINTQVLPHAYEFQITVANSLDILLDYSQDKNIKLADGVVDDRKELFAELSAGILYVRKNLKELGGLLNQADKMGEIERAKVYFTQIKPVMQHIRKHVDELEAILPDELWELPKYKEMLFIC